MLQKLTIIDSRNISLNQYVTRDLVTPCVATVLSNTDAMPHDIEVALSIYARSPIEINVIVETNEWIDQTTATQLAQATCQQAEQFLQRNNIAFNSIRRYLYSDKLLVELT